ncbi:hypothetical protein ROZALSC1DRAFT_25960, partial [Rozella allomycis CSF55]
MTHEHLMTSLLILKFQSYIDEGPSTVQLRKSTKNPLQATEETLQMFTSNKCIELFLMISVWFSWSCSLSLFDLPVEIIERITDNIEPLELQQMVCSCKMAHAWYRKDAILPSLIKYYERSVPLIELKWKIKNSAKARRQFLQDKTIHAKWHLRYFFL